MEQAGEVGNKMMQSKQVLREPALQLAITIYIWSVLPHSAFGTTLEVRQVPFTVIELEVRYFEGTWGGGS